MKSGKHKRGRAVTPKKQRHRPELPVKMPINEALRRIRTERRYNKEEA